MANYDVRRSEGETNNKLSFDIDGLIRTIVFRSGGKLENPVVRKAASSGGSHSDGLYGEWTCEGKVTVDPSLAEFLDKVYYTKRGFFASSAIHQSYSQVGNAVVKRKFNNVLLSKLISFDFEDMGGEVTMDLSFSLNDLQEVPEAGAFVN